MARLHWTLELDNAVAIVLGLERVDVQAVTGHEIVGSSDLDRLLRLGEATMAIAQVGTCKRALLDLGVSGIVD
jgi:hypothetical protein